MERASGSECHHPDTLSDRNDAVTRDAELSVNPGQDGKSGNFSRQIERLNLQPSG